MELTSPETEAAEPPAVALTGPELEDAAELATDSEEVVASAASLIISYSLSTPCLTCMLCMLDVMHVGYSPDLPPPTE